MSWTDTLSSLGAALSAIGWSFTPLLLLPALCLMFQNSERLIRLSDILITLIDGFNYKVGEIIKWGLPILVLSVAFSVFALSIFGLSWTKLSESAEYIHASVIMLGASATLMAGQHVRVDIFYDRMSPRNRALVDFSGYFALLIPVCLIILWNSQSFVAFAWRIFEGSSEADGIRGEFLLKTLIPLFCIMMLVQGQAIALRAALYLSGHKQPDRQAHTPPYFDHQEIEH